MLCFEKTIVYLVHCSTFTVDSVRCMHKNNFHLQAVVLFMAQSVCKDSVKKVKSQVVTGFQLPLQMLHLLSAGPTFCCLTKHWTSTVPKTRLEKC